MWAAWAFSLSKLRLRTSAMRLTRSGTMLVAYSALMVPMLQVVSSSMRRRFIRAMPLAATWMALMPCSGASPAWARLPTTSAKILIWPGAPTITLPTSPEESSTKARLL